MQLTDKEKELIEVIRLSKIRPPKDGTIKAKLIDISLAISWREIANTYFNKSASWLYHKLDGIDGNGGPGGFTDQEKEQLRGALYDLADRIRRAADTI